MKMRRYPVMWTLKALEIYVRNNHAQVEVHGEYVPARPWLWRERWARVKNAWRVLTGQCDALLWPEDNQR